jgi:cytochrome c-type biogenesis protein CcmE
VTRKRLWVVGGLLAVAMGLILFQGLGNATVYFKTADEAVRDRSSMGTRRFRVEGTVVADSVTSTTNGARFRIENNGAVVAVAHHGDPPELFKPGIPVVLEGHWQGATFDSDLIMVKHSEQYKAKHPDRVQGSQQNK